MSLIEHLLDGVLLVEDGRVVQATTRAAEVLSLSMRAIEGAELGEILPAEAAEVVARVLGGAASCRARRVRWERLGVDGRLSISGTPGPQPQQVVLALGPDVDPEPASLDFQRRLTWLNSLAAGMAHEIRNPLSGIRGAAQLLRRGSTPADFDELTGLIIQEADRIHVQVERLMSFCRPRPLSVKPVDLNGLLRDEVAAARARSGEGLHFEVDLDPSLPSIEGDPERLAEALGNLLRNACEAARSRVRVRTRVDPAGRLVDPDVDRGPTLRLDVEDDGEGIPLDRVGQLFVPFATTKTEGTGLGLFVARLSVDEHRGLLQVDPRPGQGARFSVLLSQRLPALPAVEDPWAGRVPVT